MMVLQFFITINFKSFDFEMCLKYKCHKITEISVKSKIIRYWPTNVPFIVDEFVMWMYFWFHMVDIIINTHGREN
jgi:hypothetical protein